MTIRKCPIIQTCPKIQAGISILMYKGLFLIVQNFEEWHEDARTYL